jgi:hypothetical protein
MISGFVPAAARTCFAVSCLGSILAPSLTGVPYGACTVSKRALLTKAAIMSSPDNPFAGFVCKRAKLTSAQASKGAENVCTTDTNAPPYDIKNASTVHSDADHRSAQKEAQKSPGKGRRIKTETEQEIDSHVDQAQNKAKPSKKAVTNILLPPAIEGFDGWIPRYDGEVLPFVSQKRNGWRERYASVCEACFEQGLPCSHYREVPLRLLIVGRWRWCAVVYVYVYGRTYVYVHACMHAGVHAYMHVCMTCMYDLYVCVYVCMHVCMYVCMYEYIYIYIYIYILYSCMHDMYVCMYV